MEYHGLDLNESSFFVDAVSVDSISFASGSNLWLLSGMITHDGLDYPFQTVYDQNPLRKDANAVKVTAPSFLSHNNEVAVSFTLTSEGDNLMLSWKVKDRFLLVRTLLISAR
jgi:hypothetical protein